MTVSKNKEIRECRAALRAQRAALVRITVANDTLATAYSELKAVRARLAKPSARRDTTPARRGNSRTPVYTGPDWIGRSHAARLLDS